MRPAPANSGGKMTEKLANTISASFLLAVALVMGILSQSLPKTLTDQYAGPGFMPTILSIGLGVCAAGILVQAQTTRGTVRMAGWSGADLTGAIRIATVAGATALYNLLLDPIGYLLVTVAYLLFLLRFLKVSWRLTLIISVVGTLGTYALFSVWLKVVLPTGLIDIYF